MNLSEIIEPNLNNYYKGTFTIHQNKVDYILIVPFTYPYKYFFFNLGNRQSGLLTGEEKKKTKESHLLLQQVEKSSKSIKPLRLLDKVHTLHMSVL